MNELNMEQIEYAIGRLVRVVESRDMTQTQLAQSSGVNQSTISKIFSRSTECGAERYRPSEDMLKKLFKAVGLKLTDILNDSDDAPDEILGYLATPLTSITEQAEKELRRVVDRIRQIAAEEAFESPCFDLYWPGEHTHPLLHADIPANHVYLTDRSRASTHDFIVLFCAAPSYGVGQESEIATQAGVPAIRLIPRKGLSRMMAGSFIRAFDVRYDGTLEAEIVFDEDELRAALQEIRRTYFRHRAFYKNVSGDSFGQRLRTLVNDRCGGNYPQVAEDLGISLAYLQNLMDEPFRVSNPSAFLLARMATRLGERVGFLVGESELSDAVWNESNDAWRKWVRENPRIEAAMALEMRDEWRSAYRTSKRERSSSSTSFRTAARPMREIDWDTRYRERIKDQLPSSSGQKSLV